MQFGSARLPSASGSVCVGSLSPSDSPGGFTQTKASMPARGCHRPLADARPGWLHQLPRWIRRSTRLGCQRSLSTVEVPVAVGRALTSPAVTARIDQHAEVAREPAVSMSAVRRPSTKSCSSKWGFHS